MPRILVSVRLMLKVAGRAADIAVMEAEAMSLDAAFGLFAAIVFIASALMCALRHRRDLADDERGLPPELRGAELAYAEHMFRSEGMKLVGRVDRAYRIDGVLNLVEFKTRARDMVYMSDVIELSVQRIAIQDATGQAVSEEAWVVAENSDTGVRRPHKVRLLGFADISTMSRRYRAIVRGRVTRPNPAKSISMCGHCAHRLTLCK